MVRFLKIAFVDLNNRIRKLKTKINTRSTEINFDVSIDFVQDTLKLLENLETEIYGVIDSGALNFEFFIPNNLYLYNDYSERYKFIDSYRAEIILKYERGERFFNRLLGQIYQESGIESLIPQPIVTLTSNAKQYYWVAQIADIYILALPRGEDECLLHLPNLYHEIGHLLCLKYKKGKMLSRFLAELRQYCLSERVRIKNEKIKVPEKQAELEFIEACWQTSWVWEMACDLIATFLVGPAYAWTALLLNANSQGEDLLYRWKQTHPPDAARVRVILMMLDKLGLHEEKKQIEQVWHSFLRLTKNPKPTTYNIYFPDHLLIKLVDEVFSFCDDSDLIPITKLLKEESNSFAVKLNDTWQNTREDQNLFDTYERTMLEWLQIKIGLFVDLQNLPDTEDFEDLTQL